MFHLEFVISLLPGQTFEISGGFVGPDKADDASQDDRSYGTNGSEPKEGYDERWNDKQVRKEVLISNKQGNCKT